MRTPALLLVVAAACSSSSSTPESTKLQTLITSDWTLQPGTEEYQCARVTLDHDIYVTEFEAIAPVGTHHSILTMDTAPTIPDNPGYPCTNPFEFAPTMVYGNGIGGTPFDFPQGVGVQLFAGTQIQLNLHLFNTSDQVLTGSSGVQVNSVSAADVANVARAEIIGPSSFTLPTGVSTQNFSCHAKSDVSLFAFTPHMHKLGTHETFKVTAAGTNAVTLYDADYSFDAQDHALITPIYQVHMGDAISFSCTYNNTTGQPVTFGPSSTNEMCIGGFWFYPAQNPFCN
jgi:hypothetical protein